MRNLEIKNNDSLAPCGRESQSGRSMIEMLGVLAIIGVLSVGGIAGYSKAMMKYRINKTIEQVTLIAGNVRTFFAPQGNYIGVGCVNCNATNGCRGHSGVISNSNPTYAQNGCPIIKKAKILPDEMITLDSTGKKITSITNPFGGWVDLISTDKAKYGDNQAFRILYNLGDNEEACIELLSRDWSNANVNFITVEYTEDDSDNGGFSIPTSIENAVEVCSHSASNGEIDMAWYFDTDLNYWKTNPDDENRTWY